MALQIFGSNSIGVGTRANLTTTDNIFVMAGVTVGSTDGQAILGTGSSHFADISGNVIGQTLAIRLGDSLSTDWGEEVVIRPGAFVSALSSAVFVYGYRSTVTNAGTISGGSYGVYIGGDNAGTTSTIVNTGTIEGGSAGIIRQSDATEKLVINNSGSIKGDSAYYGGAKTAVDEITNSGRIEGSIIFNGGDDLYDGRSGRLAGDVYGGSGNDRIYGGVDNDTFYGGTDADRLKGYAGNDTLDGETGADRMEGGTGNDKFYVDDAGDVVVEASGQGTDTVESSISYTLTNHVEKLTLAAGAGNINSAGNALANTITGNDGNNTLKGLDGNDTLLGGTGNDQLEGGTGIDKLTGDAGADKLYGGAGADQFIFTAMGDSTVASSGRDTIYDFSHAQGDRIVLSSIDADSAASGNQAFSFIGAAAFSGDEGELRYRYAGANTLVEGDVDGNGAADFAILLSGKIALVAGDFVL